MATLLHSIMSNFHLPAGTANPPGNGIYELARRAAVAVLERHQQRRELQQLLAMDDRALKDIGLTRADALSAAHPFVRTRAGESAALPPPRGEVIEYYTHRAHALRGRALREAVRHAIARLRGRR
jgi:uncharacterized protein YjiS (DUF1127 family)